MSLRALTVFNFLPVSFSILGDRPYYGTDLFREVLKRQFLSCVFERQRKDYKFRCNFQIERSITMERLEIALKSLKFMERGLGALRNH